MSKYSAPQKFIDLASQQDLIRTQIDESIKNVLNHGHYIMGPEVKTFEKDLTDYTGAKYCITCANGTDALSLVLMAWGTGPGDAVYVPSFTYVASAEAPAQLGATPFFVDVCPLTFNLDVDSFKQSIIDSKEMNLKPKAVIPVDLFGQVSNIKEIVNIAKEENIKVLCDAAQSFGATFEGKKAGYFGDATTTSFFPAKPLGCYGDGGAVFTNNKDLFNVVSSIRLHGKGSEKYDNVRVGMNSRLDTIQAAILIEKLKIFDNELRLRNKIAQKYTKSLNKSYKTPTVMQGHVSSWAQYTLIDNDRDNIIAALKSENIPSIVYYPKPLHAQDGYSSFPKVSTGLLNSSMLSNSVFSIPMYPYIKNKDQDHIISTLLNLKV